MSQVIAELVKESQTIIKEDREHNIKPAFIEAEQFLAKNKIPVNSDYDEIDFYKYYAYPITNFMNTANQLRSDVIELKSGFRLNYYIYKYIYQLQFDGYQIIVFTNIFWPHDNHKYSYLTYEAPARIDETINLQYIHPKYSLEEIYRRLYCPEFFKVLPELHIKKNKLTQSWRHLTPDNAPKDDAEIVKSHFGKNQTEFYNLVKDVVISAHYDPTVPIFIGTKSDIEKCKQLMPKGITVIENSSKSFFDPRAINYLFKQDNMILGRIWQLLDQEVIPVIDRQAHISVLIKLALTEHITYEILGFDKIATDKLALFSRLLSKEKSLKAKSLYTKITECDYIGTYYPLDKYLSTLYTNEILEKKNNPRK